MSWSAYGDESEPDGRYVLATAVLPIDGEAAAREAISTVRQPGQRKLHWHDESTARRRKIMSAIAGIDALHIVVVRAGPSSESLARQRAKCLERLLFELDAAGVERLCLEARERKQNLRDLDTLAVLRSTRSMPSQLRVTHAPGATEPLLWIADAVAGATAAALRGAPEHLVEIEQLTRIVTSAS